MTASRALVTTPGDERRASPIPSRNATVRRRVREVIDTCGYEPTTADVFAMVRWAHVYEKWRRIAEQLDEQGEVKKGDGEPRKLLDAWVRLSAELRSLESALGLTASARAALGVNLLRGHDLAELMSESQGPRDDGR